uniref:S100P-binding protein n=1 Tax=Gasterosteus aculeatus aculeatus TaxID=481459 RepID=A0AAQ4PLW5_GASAC|nr:S100P-binding protein-like isoform X2 [Gasterosteus aculeatus aculeatus]
MDKIPALATDLSNRFDRPKPLKPLSIYSRMVMCKQEASLRQRKLSDPFINYTVEVVNKKRKSQNLSFDDGYETPVKNLCSPKDLSPDLGCFMDYNSPPATGDSVSPLAVSLAASLNVPQTIKIEIKERACSQLPSPPLECGSSTGRGLDGGSVPHSLSVPVMEAQNLHVETLEGDAEESWNIGRPLFESSIQAMLGGEEDTLDTSYETTLPLQVKVKSVVVAPGQQTSSSKTAAPPLQERSAQPDEPGPRESRCFQTARSDGAAGSKRPAIFDRERDLEHQKNLYVDSVTRHMKEHQGSNKVMTELVNLMNHVADQRPGTCGRPWQHPSDLTRRNYQRRFGNVVPKMTLREWYSQKNPQNKRFAKIPTFFQRSPFP